MSRVPVEISSASYGQRDALGAVFARAFVDDQMMRWSLLGSQGSGELLNQCFVYFLDSALDLGLVWETSDSNGAAVWIPPGSSVVEEDHPWNQERILDLSDDGGDRYRSFWSWIESHIPDEPLWVLDSIAVDPRFQGRGYGRALIEAGLSRASGAGCGAFLSTATVRNLPIYTSCGFRVVDQADAPDGGPHVWFMRWEP